MGVYYFIWFVVSILAFCEILSVKEKESARKLKIVICSVLLVIFWGIVCFKGNVGTDYKSYERLFYLIGPSSSFDSILAVEPGFWYWVQFIYILGFSFVGFWFITGLINIGIKLYTFKELSPYIAVSLLIYLVGLFFERDFDGMRQGLAIGVCYWAIIEFLKKRFLYFFLLVTLAVFFHYTSALFYFIPLFARIKINNGIVFLLILISFVFFFLRIDLIKSVLLPILPSEVIYAKIIGYMNSDMYSVSAGLSIGIFFRIVIFSVFIFLEKRMKISYERFNLLKNGFLFSILISLLFNNLEILSHRMAYGFREFQIFIIPYIITAFKGKRNKIIILLLVCLYSLVLLYRLLNTPHLAEVYPYKTFWNEW